MIDKCRSGREKEYYKEYYLKHKDKMKAGAKQRHKINKSKGRKHWITRTYGITEEFYYDLLESQGWCCALCGKSSSGHNRSLCIDHDHKTGKVRGILCLGCNSKLSVIEDKRFTFLAEIYLKCPIVRMNENE